MNYEELSSNETQFLSLTTLQPAEFEVLLSEFRPLWYRFYAVRTSEGRRRKKKNWRPEKDTKTLPTVEDKLLFVLVYLKNHPIQQFHAATFGLSQSKVSSWIRVLMPILEDALKRLNCTPCRDGALLDNFLSNFDDVQVVNHDVVEQTTPRPVDDQAQRAQYSGKKKAHTYKNKVDCLDNQYVVYLSPTFVGSVHDKKIADEVACQYPEGIRLRQDAGFQGYAPNGVQIVMPFKKPRNAQFSDMQLWFNEYVGQRRVVIEHAIRGIKRCHIVQHACRLTGFWVRDQIMNICTAIHNLRVRSPYREYAFGDKMQI